MDANPSISSSSGSLMCLGGDVRRFYRASLRSVVLVKVTVSLSTDENSHNVDLYWRSQDHLVTARPPGSAPDTDGHNGLSGPGHHAG